MTEIVAFISTRGNPAESRAVTTNSKTDRTDRTDPDRSVNPRTEKKPKPETEKPTGLVPPEPNRTEPNRILDLAPKRRRFVPLFFFFCLKC